MDAPYKRPSGIQAMMAVARSGFRAVAMLFGAVSLAGALWLPFGSSALGAPDWLFWLVAAPVLTVGGVALKRRAGLDGARPGLAALATRRSRDALGTLRATYFSFLGALVSIAVVAFILDGELGGATAAGPVAVGVAAFGVVMLVAGRIVERPLDCSSDDALVGSYRTRFFLRVVFAESAALVGFVGVVVTGTAWVYLVGFAVSLVGFARLAPTDGRLRTEQFELTSAGCGRDLVGLLREAPPG